MNVSTVDLLDREIEAAKSLADAKIAKAKRAVEAQQAKLARAFEKTKKLWLVLQIGLDDLALAEKSPTCKIDMDMWRKVRYQDDPESKCVVCLAGSVLRNRYGDREDPSYTNTAAQYRMYALNFLREGNVGSAAASLNDGVGCNLDTDRYGELDRIVPSYDYDRTGWWKAMRQLVRDLKKHNL